MKNDHLIALSFEGETIKLMDSKDGVLFNDLAYVCLNQETKEVLSIGAEAKKMLAKVDQPLAVINPVADSEILDEPTFFLLLASVCEPLKQHFQKANLIISTSDEITSEQKTALIDFFKTLKVNQTALVSETYLAALGSGCLVDDAYPTLFLNIGYQSTTIAIMQAKKIISSVKLNQAEKSLSQALADYFIDHYQLEIKPVDEKNIYFSIASVTKQKFSVELIITGRDLENYSLKKVVVGDEQVRSVFVSLFSNYRHEIIELLATAPTQIRTGIAKNGLVVSGTLARIYGIQSFFTDYFDFPTTISKYPNQAALQGALKYDEHQLNKNS